jgi:putative PIN family toxin of toxin-antitoxin system
LRFVFDANVLVSALLSRTGAPSRLLERWLEGELELVVCDQLFAELERTLGYPKLRRRIPEESAVEFLGLLPDLGELVPDPSGPPPAHSTDPDDDYLIALAAREHAHVVSGDEHLLALRDAIPVLSPREALEQLD